MDLGTPPKKTISRDKKKKETTRRRPTISPPSLEEVERLKSSISESSSEPVWNEKRNVKPPIVPNDGHGESLVDPTWFFPVGEPVIHRNFGKGVVLDHPPFQDIDDAQVRVKFENGKVLEFPALGSDIIPDMGY